MGLAQSQPQVIIQENKELKEIIARLSWGNLNLLKDCRA